MTDLAKINRTYSLGDGSPLGITENYGLIREELTWTRLSIPKDMSNIMSILSGLDIYTTRLEEIAVSMVEKLKELYIDNYVISKTADSELLIWWDRDGIIHNIILDKDMDIEVMKIFKHGSVKQGFLYFEEGYTTDNVIIKLNDL